MAQNYSQKDFVGIYEELLDIVEASTTRWSPRTSTEADPGVVILKLIAMLEDRHGYRFDMARAQGYLDGVSDRQSAYELLKMLGYLMRQARAATGVVELYPTSLGWNKTILTDDGTESVEPVAGISIPRFTVLTDASKTLQFFTTDEMIITRDSVFDKDNNFIADKVFRLSVQAGEPFQITKDGYTYFTLKDIDEQGRLYLGKTGLAQNGVFVYDRLTIDDEEVLASNWTYLDFAILKPQGKWYMVQTAETGEMYVQFPSNFESLIGSTELVVYATYTNGSSSNVSADSISLFMDTDTYREYFVVSQPEAFYTGQDEESITQASNNYYATKDICNTLVSAADFESAIKYLLASFELASDGTSSTDIIYPKKGQRYFSNVVVKTAKDRKTKVRTSANGTDYTLYVPNKLEPSNQIDVIALQQPNATEFGNSDSYKDSFKRLTNDLQIQFIEADIAQQLQDNITVDAEIKIDTKTPRILAVTTPEIVIRMTNYSATAAAKLKAQIQKHFYSTYSAENLVAGQALDYQRIVDDIRALSPDILSVSMRELEYTAYQKYAPVDGVTVDMEGSVSAAANEEVRQQAEAEALQLGNLNNDIVAKSVLAGDVPLFRFYNRQNTRTKQTAAYAVLAGGASNGASSEEGTDSSDTKWEPTMSIPWNASDFRYIGDSVSTPIKPTVVQSWGIHPDNAANYTHEISEKLSRGVRTGTYATTDDSANDQIDKYIGFPILNDNQILQVRKPVMNAAVSYGFGYRYTFERTQVVHGSAINDSNSLYYLPIMSETILLPGTLVKKDSLLDWDGAEQTFNPPEDIVNKSGKVLKDFTITGNYLALTPCTVTRDSSGEEAVSLSCYLASGTVVAYGSTINGTPYKPDAIPPEEEYKLKEGETLTITKSSTGAVVETFSEGDYISVNGVELTQTTATSQNILLATQSISKLEETHAVIPTGYVYFMTLNRGNDDFTLTVDNELMLEEGEYFLYADKNITEYVTLGPGTRITLSSTAKKSEVKLTNTSISSVTSVPKHYFKDIPDEIVITPFEISTYLKGNYVVCTPLKDERPFYDDEHNIIGTYYDTDFLSSWTKFSTSAADRAEVEEKYGNILLRVYRNARNPDQLSNDNLVAEFTDDSCEVRMAVKIETDEDGVAELYYPSAIQLSSDSAPIKPEKNHYSFITSSVPFSGVYAVSDNDGTDDVLLLPKGISARLSTSTVNVTSNNDAANSTHSFTINGVTIYMKDMVSGEPQDILITTIALPSDFCDAARPDTGGSAKGFILLNGYIELPDNFDFNNAPELTFAAKDYTGEVEFGKVRMVSPNLTELDTEVTVEITKEIGYNFTLLIVPDFDKISKNSSYVMGFTVSISSGAALSGAVFHFDNLSYVTSYSSEINPRSSSLYDSILVEDFSTDSDSLVGRVLSLAVDTSNRFNWLGMPTEQITNPTDAENFFNSVHPYNSVTFPYINVSLPSIKIIPER